MEFESSKKDLLKSLATISSIVNERQTIPILSHVLIESKNQTEVVLSATDLKVSVEASVPSNVVESGSITVPAKRFLQIIKELPEANVRCVVNAHHQVLIECLNSEFKITGLPKEEFPPISFYEDQSFVLEQKTFKEALKEVLISISSDTTRHILNGVFMQFSRGKIVMVATDGRRLSHIQIDAAIEMDGEQHLILPGKMAQELLRVLQDEGSFNLTLGEKEVVFNFETTRYMSQLIDGKYPNFEQVIPKDVKHLVSLNRELLMGALRRSAVLVDQKLNRIKVELKPGQLVISTKTPELGESKEEIDIAYDGEEISVGFAPNYLLDGLKVMSEDEVSFGLTEGGKAGVLRTNDRFLYVIMPMRLV